MLKAALFCLSPFVLVALLTPGPVSAAESATPYCLNFPKNGVALDDVSRHTLQVVYASLSGSQDHLVLHGHADDQGGDAVNLAISLRRAKAAADFLRGLGLSDERIDKTDGLGKTQPLNSDLSEDSRHLNRRVEIFRQGQKLDLVALVQAAAAPTPIAASPAPADVTVAATAATPIATPAVTPIATPAAAPAPTPAPTAIAAVSPADRFALGIGYPDVRARYSLGSRLDVEAKVALADFGQAYSGRAYFKALAVGPLNVDLGAEAGYLKFSQTAGLNGDGYFGEPFAGLDYGFGGRWRVTVDLGPAWIDLASQGESLGGWQWTYNTALYLYLF